MSDIAGELARVRVAFAKPTLTLLAKRKWAPVVLSIFIASFSRDQDVIAAERFHAQVAIYLAELRSLGEEVPDGAARVLCRRWVDEQWLVLSANDDKAEEYSLTSHAQEAIDYVHRLSGSRSMFSESRIRTILEAARRCAMDANPDREDRLRRLDEQIGRLTAERERIAAGGAIDPLPDDRLIEEYLNLRDLIAQLPADFMRVSESVKAIHRGIVADFREEARRTGEVLDSYLTRSSDLMAESQEGRAFTGAVELLRDDRLLKELREDLGSILQHSFAQALTPLEAREFRNTVVGIRHGIDVVLEQRRRLSATLRAHITRHDAIRDRELDDALRRVKTELAAWMQVTGARSRLDMVLGLPSLELAHLRQRFYNPDDYAPPPPLRGHGDDAVPPLSMEQLRQQGGPSLAEFRAALYERLRDGAVSVTAGEVFRGVSDELRRPVEVLGLIQIAAAVHALDPARDDGSETFEAVRPDGSRRTFEGPRLKFGQAQLAALGDDKQGGADD
ncbi:DUF3375 domain-containing protein [Micromonospora sicca]|uniref:DUF3375 domain-containing protein n=1 Tax=Micromonospora sicca TaxID=2202420 RepID=UPI001374C877|nr:DUF3375 domain-containing protein [Micromonospora sp. 4G51]